MIEKVDKSAPNSAWFFADLSIDKEFKAGDIVDIQIMRTGEWNHQLYGKVKVTANTIEDVVNNFKTRERGIDLAVDENHEPNHRALAWFKELYTKGRDALYASLELTKEGADLLSKGSYKYFSPEIMFKHIDEETGEQKSNLLIGGAFTNRPFFKNMESLMASEVAVDHQNTNLHLSLTTSAMKEVLNLIDSFNEKEAISIEEKNALTGAFNELDADSQSRVKELVDIQLAKFNDEESEVVAEDVAEEVEESTEEETEEVADEEEASEVVANEDSEEESEEEATDEEISEVEESEEESEEAEEVAANEITVSASSFSELQSEVSKLRKEAHDRLIDDTVSSLLFNEETNTGSVLPKNKEKLVKIFSDMSDKHIGQVAKFLKENPVMSFNEIGSSEEPKAPAIDPEIVKMFEEKAGMPREYAEKAAAEYMEKTKK